MIKISIIIPIYNVAQYVLRCLNSVMYQTYDRPMECLLVDDCGTDNSVQIVEDFIANYKGSIQFRLLHHDYNRGLSAARNTGLNAANGDYVYFLDSDDELPLNAIEHLISMLKIYPSAEIIQGTITSIPNNPYYEMDCFRETPVIRDNIQIRKLFYTNGKTIPVNGVNKLIKRSFLTQNKLFFQEGLLHEDEHWMFYVVKYLQDLVFVFEPTYIRYYNEGSIMMTLNPLREAQNIGYIVYDWVDNLDAISSKDQLKKILYFYNKFKVSKYNLPGDRHFRRKVWNHLYKLKQFKALIIFSIWLILRPIKNRNKYLRISFENIHID